MQSSSQRSKFLGISLAIGILLGFSLTGYSQPPELLPQTRNLIHLQALGRIIRLYSQNHSGKYPESWAKLARSGVAKKLPSDLGELRYEVEGGKQRLTWLCFPGASTSSPPKTIVAASPMASDDPEITDLRLVLYADLSVKRIPDTEYQSQISKQQPAHPTP